MCTHCGCSVTAKTSIHKLDQTGSTGSAHGHAHAHDHDHPHAHPRTHTHDHVHSHGHSHDHDHPQSTTKVLEQRILAKNDQLAERNRIWFEQHNILALNLVSSPGAGKTTLLERTIRDLSAERPIAVIEGDQATARDAERIQRTGCQVVQINTGTGCHLEAAMLADGLHTLQPPQNAIVMIENVGNLVCPALFDLGERAKVVILSVTEGEDKPLKYPHMFRAADIMILNKIDLLPYLQFDLQQCLDAAYAVNPALQVFQLSATTGAGLSAWYDWLRSQSSVPLSSVS
ncbi:MAG: hydrogenase nickel incorporation protein HypB [Gammaproteobacteria bacterium]